MKAPRYKSIKQIPAHCIIASIVESHKTSRRKYGNVPTVVNGIKFDSKREADYYKSLLLLKAAGAIRGFVRQVSILLPSGRRLRLDYVVNENDGRIRWIDAKGYATSGWCIKKDEAQAALGITIELV